MIVLACAWLCILHCSVQGLPGGHVFTTELHELPWSDSSWPLPVSISRHHPGAVLPAGCTSCPACQPVQLVCRGLGFSGLADMDQRHVLVSQGGSDTPTKPGAKQHSCLPQLPTRHTGNSDVNQSAFIDSVAKVATCGTRGVEALHCCCGRAHSCAVLTAS